MNVTLDDAGAPNWTNLASPDLEASKRFYTGVFGWDPQVSPSPEADGCTLFHKGEAAVARLGPLNGVDQPPAWPTQSQNRIGALSCAPTRRAGQCLRQSSP